MTPVLYPAELDVIKLIADGFDTAQIAERRVVAVNTVKRQRSMILLRLGQPHMAAAVAYALRHGIIK